MIQLKDLTPKSLISFTLRMIAALLLFVLMVGPMWWMVVSSFKTTGELFVNRWGFPWNFTFENYPRVWVDAHIGEFFLNSAVISVVAVSLMVFTGAMASYAIVRFRNRIRGTNATFFYFVAGHIVTAQVIAVSVFLFAWVIGLENTRVGLALVYCASGLPFVVILCRGFFATVTRELFEAAEIDGCSEPGIFGLIMLPLSKPVLATAVIFQFTYVWNEFVLALVLIRSGNKLTLPIGVFQAVMDRYQTDFTAAFAAVTITSIPVIAIYLAAQRQFTGGLGGALKG